MRNTKKSFKQSSQKKQHLRNFLIKAGIGALFVLGLYIAAGHAVQAACKSVFPLKKIVFSGNRHLSDSELRAMIGINSSKSLLKIQDKNIAEEIMKSPWVRTVSFRKELPDSFLVKIEESAPSAIVEMNRRRFLIDDKGSVLEELKSGSVPFLPVITGNPFKNREILLEVIELVKTMKKKDFISTKDRIEIITPNSLKPEEIAMLADGLLIKVGFGNYNDKLERLMELEDEIMKRKIPIDYIDLRFEKKVVVKPINEVVK